MGPCARAASVGSALDLISNAADQAAEALSSAGSLLTKSEEAAGSGAIQHCRDLIATVRDQVPVIRETVNSLAANLSASQSQSQAARLQQDVARLTQRVEQLEQLVQGNRRHVMLGEVAFLLDKAAHTYVLGGGGHRKRATLGELRTRAYHGELSDDELRRWRAFCAFLERKGWPVSEACTTSAAIKDLCSADAHSTEADKQEVTLEQLQQWAGTEVPSDVVDDCTAFVQLVASFGKEGRPLLPVQDVAAVVEV